MSAAWTTIIALTIGTAAIKAAGPVLVGGRELPRRFERVVALFAPALLAALIVVETFGGPGRTLVIDARAAGLAAAAVVLATTNSLVGSIVGAATVTALVRLIS
jgi:branched-subunit amino acid transport protein